MHGFSNVRREQTYGWMTAHGVGVAWISIQPGAQIHESPQDMAKVFRPPFRHPNGVVELLSRTPGADNGTPSVFLLPGTLVEASGTEDQVRMIPAQRLVETEDLPGDVAMAFVVQGAMAARIADERDREPLFAGMQRATFFVRAERIDGRVWYDTATHATAAKQALLRQWNDALTSCEGVGLFARMVTRMDAETDGRVLIAHAVVPDAYPRELPKCHGH